MKNLINQFLSQYGKQLAPTRLGEATQYALEAGGKRLRPLIMLSLIQSYGMDYVPYVPLACALEMVHIYSLIHDDLPAMDDDDLRHGKPTLHKAFDEATAILVGDGLLTNAFGVIAQQAILTDAQKIKLITILSEGAGLTGMVYGQHLDMASEGKKLHLRALEEISLHKTGKLLEAAFLFGSMIASPNDHHVWSNIGLNLGLMFQIQDDVLEATTSVETMMKSKSDDHNQKATFVSQLGLETAQSEIERLFASVQVDMKRLHLENPLIEQLLMQIYERKY
jgi:geranylgeranyl diphosphate synthase, type II